LSGIATFVENNYTISPSSRIKNAASKLLGTYCMNNTAIVPMETIENQIYLIRGQKVMIDYDLASLYGVPTKRLNEQVKRNIKRFTGDFMFVLSNQEKEELVAICDRFSTLKHSTSNPYAFTEQGIAMLSSVLNSERAIYVNIEIMRAFVRIRHILSIHKELAQKIELLEKRVFKHDADIRELVRDIRKMTINRSTRKHNVGFLIT